MKVIQKKRHTIINYICKQHIKFVLTKKSLKGLLKKLNQFYKLLLYEIEIGTDNVEKNSIEIAKFASKDSLPKEESPEEFGEVCLS